MGDKVTQIKEMASGLTYSSTPELVNALITVATDFLVEILKQRGLTGEEAIARAREITASELDFIDSEIAKYSAPPIITDPVPAVK